MKKLLLVFCIALLTVMSGLRASAQTFDWSCFPTSGVILADNNVIANLNLTNANCSVANGWIVQCQGTGEQRILTSSLGGNPYIRMQKVGTDATFNFARILTASGSTFTLQSISVTPTSVGAAAGGGQVITLHAYLGGREQGSTSTALLNSVALVNIPQSQLGAFQNIDEIRFTSDKPAAFGVGIDDVVITTAATAPSVTTDNSSAVTASTATLTGTVTADGGAAVSEKGIVYATTANPTTANTTLTNGAGTGAISVNASALAGGTTYHFRAYATNTIGTTYGADKTFTTLVANRAPVATADNYSFQTGVALNIVTPGVLSNDTDADGDALTAVLVSGPANGSLALNPNGSFTYTSAGKTNDQFTYRANDGKVSGNTVTVTLTHVNTAPVAVANNYNFATNVPLNVAAPGVLGNDTDADGDALTAVLISGPANGSLTLNANGSFTYTSTGTTNDQFTYKASDGIAIGNTVTVTLTHINSKPVATDDNYTVNQNANVSNNVLSNDTDPDGNNLTSSLVTAPVNGTVVLNADGSFTYTPNAGYAGTDSFDYQVCDNGVPSLCDTATAHFNVASVNQPPVLTVTAGTTVFSGANAVIDPGITVSDDGSTLASGTVSITGGLHSGEDRLVFIANGSTGDITGSYSILTGVLILQSPSGTATIAQWQAALRATVYRNIQASPTTNTRTITFSVNDGSLDSNPVSKSVSIALPVAVADNYSFKTGTALTVAAPGVLNNDTDAGGNPLTAVLVSGSANGTLTLNADGSFAYTSTGTTNDQFTYKVNNGNLDGNTVAVTLTHGNSNPVATDDTYTLAQNANVSGNVLSNDTDPDGNSLTSSLVTAPVNGTVVLNADGSFTYTPNVGYSGTDSFKYQVCDNGVPSLCDTATTNFTISPPVNQPPVVTTSAGSTVYAAVPVIVDPGVTVTDVDNTTLFSAFLTIQTGFQGGDKLAFAPIGDVGNITGLLGAPGTFSLTSVGSTATIAQWQNALRSITFQSTSANTGDRTITLMVNDGLNNSSTALKTITYSPSAINTTGTLSALTTTYGTASASGTFNVSGLRLSAGILVTAPAGFEVSGDNTTFTPTVTIGAAGNIASTPVYIRLAAGSAAGTYSGDILLSSNGVTTVKVPTVASTVNRKALTVTAKNITKTYGQALTGGATTTEFTATGLVGTETVGNVTIAYGTGAAANAAVNTYTGSVTASAAGGGTFNAANYTITYVAGNIVVNKAALTVTASNKGKAFGATLTSGAGSTDFTSTGLVGTETIGSVTITYGAGAAAAAPVGPYPGSIVPSAATGGTFNAANYTITYVAGTLTVGQAILTITANNASKTYGAAVPTLSVTYSGFVGTDDPSSLTTQPTISTTAVANSPVGTYAITASGAASPNYTIVYNPGTLTVTPAVLTVTASNANKTYGAANPVLGVTYSGFVGTDNAASLTTAPTATTAAVANSPVGTYAITASGAVSSNYTFSYKPSTLTVTQAALTITATNQTKTYGQTLTGGAGSTAFTSSGLAGTETIGSVTLTYGTGAAAGAAVNTYTGAIVPSAATGGTFNAANYAITYVAGNITVGKAAITVTAAAGQNKVYGNVDPTLTYTITTGALVGTDAFTGSLTRAAGENAGTYAIQKGSLALNGNYTLTYVGANFTINKRAITVTANAQNKVYGAADPFLTYGITTGSLAFADTFSGSLTRVAGENVGTYAIQQGTLALSSNYVITYVGANLTIGKAAITVTADAKNKTYGAADPVLTYKITSGALIGTDAFTGSLTRDAGENVGVYAIKQGTLALGGNYTLTYAGANLTIGKAAITVTANAQNKVYGNVDPTLTYAVTAGALVGTDTFTGSLARDAGENAGTYAIKQGTLALGTNYTLTYVGANLTIGKAAVTVTANAQNKVYGAADPALTYSVTSGSLKFADTFTGSLTRDAGENVGIYAIKQGTLALSSNYTLTYAGANLTIAKAAITVTADAKNKVYGAADPALTYNISSGALIGTDKLTGALTRAAGENVGTYVIQQGTLSAGTNYTLTYVGANLTIGKAAITVTANAQNKVYGNVDPTLTYTITTGALVGTDTFTGSLTRAAGENVGIYAIQQGTLALGGNYTLTYVGANLTIGKAAITVTANAKNKVYGAADPVLTYSITSGSLKFADTFSGSLTRAAGENVGTYAIQQGTLALSSNYTLTYVGADLTIGKAAITVTANAQNKVYGAADPALTYAVTSGALVGTDKFTGSLTRAAGENVGTYAIQQGTLALSSNYTLTYAGANLTIGKAAITVTADAKNKVYGAADPALTYAVTTGALVGTDKFTGALTRAAGENVGTYAIQQGTLALSSNYTLTYVGANLTIGKAAITVTADAKNKIYGDADPLLTYKITAGGLIGTDKFTGLLTRAAGENVGTYAIQQGTLALSGNYTLTYVGANLTIGKAAITVTADAKNKVYGDADPALTYKITTGALVGKDAFTGSLTRDAGESVGTYAIKQGTLALSGNYTLTYAGASLTIGKAAITVTADAKNKVYGDADPVLTYKITTGALVGADKFTGSLTRAAGENIGTYAIQQGTLALNGNYTLTYVGANLTIGKAAITVTANAQNKIYGTTDPALTYAVTTGALVGTDKFTGALTRAAGENVGTYAIQQGTLALNGNYTLTYVGANLTIGKAAITVTAKPQTKEYGTTDPALTYTVTTGALVGTDKFTGALSRVTGENVGTYAIQQGTLALSSNYTLTYVGANLIITQKVLTITANSLSKTYGSANPTLTVSYNGFVNGENSGTLTTQPAVITTATQSSAAGTYPITVSGAAGANYKITYVAGTLTVNKAVLTITAENKSRLFGVANPTLTLTYSGFVNGDDQADLTKQPVLSTTANATSLPGLYPITVSGATSANYTFNYVQGTLTVIPLSNAKLINLVPTAGTVTPSFDSNSFSYNAQVDNEVAFVRLTLTFDPTATATINGSSAPNNQASFAIPLNVGNNTLTIVVTAQDHITRNTYTLTIYRGEDQKNIVASNILTPNGDGKNDTWVIADIQLFPNNTVTVFDKGGRTVYTKHGYTNDWNGTYGGAPLTEGTYYYVIDLGPQKRKFKGFITIIHDR